MTTGRNIVLFAILLLGLIFLFRLYCLRLKDKYGFRLVYIMYISILFFISFFCYFFRIYLLSRFGLHLNYPFFIAVGAPSTCILLNAFGAGGDDHPSSSFFEGLSAWVQNTPEPGEEVNSRPSQGVGQRLPGSPLEISSPGEEAGPSNPVQPYPYQPDQVIGGDCVSTIERRLLSKHGADLNYVVCELARINAEELFEKKVEILKEMSRLDPEGPWLERGARALDNPRTSTGEESLERLYAILEELQKGGRRSGAFAKLTKKMG